MQLRPKSLRARCYVARDLVWLLGSFVVLIARFNIFVALSPLSPTTRRAREPPSCPSHHHERGQLCVFRKSMRTSLSPPNTRSKLVLHPLVVSCV